MSTGIFTLIICIQFDLLLGRRNATQKINKTATDFSAEEKIKNYVNSNISSVTVASTKEQFKINNIYDLFEDESPATSYLFYQLNCGNVKCCFTREDNFQKQKVKIFFNFLLEYCLKI